MRKLHHWALGALALGACPAVFALGQTDVDNAAGTSNEFFFSGASASDNDVVGYLKNGLCQTPNRSLESEGLREAKLNLSLMQAQDRRAGRWRIQILRNQEFRRIQHESIVDG